MSDKSVWVVSSGSYSDYRVHCAAPSKEAAKAIVVALNGDETCNYFIEQVPVIDKAEKVNVYGMEAVISDRGNLSGETTSERSEWNVDPLFPERMHPVTIRWVRAPCYYGTAGRLEVYGTDRELVREAFASTKAQLLADPALRKRREFTR